MWVCLSSVFYLQWKPERCSSLQRLGRLAEGHLSLPPCAVASWWGSVSVAKGLAYLMPGAVGKGLSLGPERHRPKLMALLSSCVTRELPESNLELPHL